MNKNQTDFQSVNVLMADIKYSNFYGQGYPENCDEVLDCVNFAVVCSFNRPGSLLAVGCNDGSIIVWDTITRNIIRTVSAHVRPITTISWSRYGEKILAGSSDWTVSIFNSTDLDLISLLQFSSQITHAELNPRNSQQALICMHYNFPELVELITGSHYSLIDPETVNVEKSFVARFDRKGRNVFLETGRGKMIVFDSTTRFVLRVFRIRSHTTAPITALSMEFSHKGRDGFLINCNDRTIRLYNCDDVFLSTCDNLEPVQCYKDLVSRSLWRKCCFSSDGEYVVAGASGQHSIFIWERATGGLVKMLTGMKGEILSDLAFHPIRPVIYSICNGLITVWSDTYPECWSAYAPTFKELEENVEYQEKEDEFDIQDQDKPMFQKFKKESSEEKDIFFDILTMERPLYCSSDEDGQEQIFNTLANIAEEYYPDKSDSS